MYKLELVYEKSGKRYIFSFEELVKSIITEEQLNIIKKAVIKEVQRL